MAVVGVALAGGPGGEEVVPAPSSAPVPASAGPAPVVGAASPIGDRVDAPYGDVTLRPATGEDGLMGGITFGTNVAWQSDGR